jgi:hypothetical protein
MKERLITLLCALGALLLFMTLLMHGGSGAGNFEGISRPTSVDPGVHGYSALADWLAAAHIGTRSQRTRFSDARGSDTGNLLLLTLPAARAYRSDELRALESWVRGGNSLLILAALIDHSDWAPAAESLTAGQLNLLTGLEFEPLRAGVPAAQVLQPLQPLVITPTRPQGYFTGVRKVIALTDSVAQHWSVKVPAGAFVLTLARTQEGSEVLWTRSLGAGHIIVSGAASLFGNAALGMADNGRLLSNIIGAQLRPGGVVIFDDVHQGLGNAYDAERFWSDPRLHLTLLILSLLWLSWVIGTGGLRLPARRAPGPQASHHIEVTGGFMARVLSPVTAAQRLVQNFAHELGLAAAAAPVTREQLLRALSHHASLDPDDLRQLDGWCAQLARNRRVPLVPLHNLLGRMQRCLKA